MLHQVAAESVLTERRRPDAPVDPNSGESISWSLALHIRVGRLDYGLFSKFQTTASRSFDDSLTSPSTRIE